MFTKPDTKSAKKYELQKEDIIFVYIEWKENPGKYLHCVFFDIIGKPHKGYILNKNNKYIEWLEAG